MALLKVKVAPYTHYRGIISRGYAELAPIGGLPFYDIKTTSLSNNVVVSCAENQSPISRVSIVFRAGPRYESSDNIGVTHVLRSCAGLSTKNASQFSIIRNIQQVGATLRATSDRETISYSLVGTREAVEHCLPFLSEVACQQVFKPWEVSDNYYRVKLDLERCPLQAVVMDLLHRAAYRRGLGNSMFCPPCQVGKISTETLQHYVCSNFTGDRAAVVGLGVNDVKLITFATGLILENGEGNNDPSVYKGGEVRSERGGDTAFVAIAGRGAPLKDTNQCLDFAVLQRALGTGPQVHCGSSSSPLTKAISAATTCNYSATSFNVNYSDCGLFGILLAVPSYSAKETVSAAINFLKNATITDEDVKRAKNQLKAALMFGSENGANTLYHMGAQAALVGVVGSATELACAVDLVSKEDVDLVLKKAVEGQLSMAATGHISNVPYLDEV